MKKKNKTTTSSFGISGRVSHDSSKFYNGKIYNHFNAPSLPATYKQNTIHLNNINKIYHKSSERMDEIPDNSIHLIITSPPYNVGKEYDTDLTMDEYFDLIDRVFKETYRVLVWGGRACINVANLGRKPYIPLHSYIINILNDIGFLMRGEIIWDKGSSSGTSTAWGSWCSPTNPTLRDIHEYILIFSKGSFAREGKENQKESISKKEFLEFTKSIWSFPSASATQANHPAPFPLELPYRLIQLYSFRNDIVLDPFCGSGTTCLAAKKTGRYYLGYDIEQKYVERARQKLQQLELSLKPAEL